MPRLLNPFSLLERRVLFAPQRDLRGTPEHVGLCYEDIFPVTTDGLRLHGWNMPGESDVVWIIFHGNGGNISVRLDQYQEIQRRYGASVIAIDYRGYGLSEGVPSGTGFYDDSLTTYRLVRQIYPQKKIVLFGRSMGGAVAAQLASVVSTAALLLEASIASIANVIREHAAWTRHVPISLLFRSKFDTQGYVASRAVPTLMLHGDCDRTVSYTNSERILSSVIGQKKLHIVTGGEHDGLDLVDPDEYHGVISEFLSENGAL